MQHNTIHQSSHPLVQHKISALRDKQINRQEFRRLVYEITLLLTYEATRNLPTENHFVETPLAKAQVPMLSEKDRDPVLIPILRAGLGMQQAFLDLMPNSKVGYVGVQRNEETIQPELYYCKFPKDIAQRTVFICDPMLATGGTANFVLHELKKLQVKNITLISIIASEQGIAKVHNQFADVPIYVGCVDKELNKDSYIHPGLGDAGDRLFGTYE